MNEKMKQWFEASRAVTVDLDLKSIGGDTKPLQRVNLPPDKYFAFIAEIKDEVSPDEIRLLYAPKDGDQAATYIKESIDNRKTDLPSTDTIILAYEQNNEAQWEDVGEAAEGWLEEESLDSKIVVKNLNLLRKLRTSGVAYAKDIITRLVETRKLHHHFIVAHEQKQVTNAASILLTILRIDPSLSGDPGWNRSPEINGLYQRIKDAPQEVSELIDRLFETSYKTSFLETLLLLGQSHEDAKHLSVEFARRLLTLEKIPNQLKASLFIDTYQLLSPQDSDTLTKLTKRMCSERDLWAHLAKQDYKAELVQLYYDCFNVEDVSVPKEFIDFIKTGLASFQKDKWLEDLRQGGYGHAILERLVVNHPVRFMDHRLREALEVLAKEVYDGKYTTPSREVDFIGIISLLKKEEQDVLQDNLRDHVSNHEGSVESLLHYFESSILDCQSLSRNSDQFVRQVVPKIIRGGSEKEAQWLSELVDKCPGFLSAAGLSTQTSLKGIVKDEIHKAPEHQYLDDLSQVVGKVLGLNIKKIVKERDVQDEDAPNEKSDGQ